MKFVQSSISDYFPSVYIPPKPLGLSFLNLPYRIRRQVYIGAGLVRECPIDLNCPKLLTKTCFSCLETFGDEHPDVGKYKCPFRIPAHRHNLCDQEDAWLGWPTDCTCQPLPYQLLFVSRKVYEEVSAILYSENLIFVSVNLWNRLKPLERLGPRELSHLTSVAVRLDRSACVDPYFGLPGEQDHYDFYEGHRGCFPKPKRIQFFQADKRTASEWRMVARRLALNIQPGRLHLTLICTDFSDRSSLLVITDATSKLKLKDCTIRLGINKASDVSALAQSTSSAATSKATFHSSSFSSFPFTSLPAELQQNVLFQSDLVFDKAIDWNHCSKAFTTYRRYERGRCCGSCAPVNGVCCCPDHHSAYSTTCTCVSVALQKLHVNRRMRSQAINAFYTCNEFNIQACRMWWHDRSYQAQVHEHPAGRQALLSFLSHIRPSALQRIRRLSFSITNLDWNVLRLLKTSLQVSKLRITLLVDSDLGHDYDDWGNSAPYSPTQTAKILQGNAQTVELLKNLTPVEFWVYLSWPIGMTEEKEVRHKRERNLEQIVMGCNYDGYERGKVDNEESFTRRFW